MIPSNISGGLNVIENNTSISQTSFSTANPINVLNSQFYCNKLDGIGEANNFSDFEIIQSDPRDLRNLSDPAAQTQIIRSIARTQNEHFSIDPVLSNFSSEPFHHQKNLKQTNESPNFPQKVSHPIQELNYEQFGQYCQQSWPSNYNFSSNNNQDAFNYSAINSGFMPISSRGKI